MSGSMEEFTHLTLTKAEVGNILNSSNYIQVTSAIHIRDKTRPTVDQLMAFMLNAKAMYEIVFEALKKQVPIEVLGDQDVE